MHFKMSWQEPHVYINDCIAFHLEGVLLPCVLVCCQCYSAIITVIKSTTGFSCCNKSIAFLWFGGCKCTTYKSNSVASLDICIRCNLIAR